MDPEQGNYYMLDRRRLTAVRVAGVALELAFEWVYKVGLFGLRSSQLACVEVGKVASPNADSKRRKMSFEVKPVHRRAIYDGVQDALPRLSAAGYHTTGVLASQEGHLAKHGAVLEYRQLGMKVLGEYSCELKLRTFPAKRELARGDCASLFTVACSESKDWRGQRVLIIEITNEGDFLRSCCELLVRGKSRKEPVNVWDWTGRTALLPPPSVGAAPQVVAHPKVLAAPRALAAPMRAAPTPKRPFTTVRSELHKFDTDLDTR